jgi:hypothetical protein
MSFAVTFIKEGAIESLATLTNSFIFIVFVIVHALVLINHHKTSQKKSGDKIKLLREYPWYAVAGLGISVVYLLKSFTYN